MAETFPVTLAGALFSALQVGEQASTRTDNSEIGPATYQLLSLNGPTDFQVTWLFYPFDFQVFEGWWRYDLLKGANSFDIDLPVGAGIKSHECNFTGDPPYTVTYQGRLVRVSATLRALAKQYVSEDDYDDILILADLITDKNKMPVIKQILQTSGTILPNGWQDIDYGTDTEGIDLLCPLVTVRPTGSPDHDFGTQSAPFNVISSAIPITGCQVVYWEIDVAGTPSLVTFTFGSLYAPGNSFNLYIFNNVGTLVGEILKVDMAIGTITFESEAFGVFGVGTWTAVAVGNTSDDIDTTGIACRAIIV